MGCSPCSPKLELKASSVQAKGEIPKEEREERGLIDEKIDDSGKVSSVRSAPFPRLHLE